MKQVIRSNRCTIKGISGYMPRLSNGTHEECNAFQKSLRAILDMNGLRSNHADYTLHDSIVGDILVTVVDSYVQDKVEELLFWNYRCRFKIDLS